MNSSNYFLLAFFLIFIGSLIYLQFHNVKGKKDGENKYLLGSIISCFLLLSLVSCKNPAPSEQSTKQSDTIELADLYFDGMKFEYLPKELKGSTRTDDFSTDAFAQDTQLLLHSRYSKSYIDPKDNRYEATVIIYEVPSEQELIDKTDECIEFVKMKNFQSALRIGRFFIMFSSYIDMDHFQVFDAEGNTKFSNDEYRKIFENFYLSKGAEVVYQAQTDEDDFYFYKP
ncbi:hypothetical protein [Chryseobacterium sp.]|uniref:hypothetical protein n=1 Tax=Chryseobacterium sp. TaxID=1871047 RepID=UPI00321A1589